MLTLREELKLVVEFIVTMIVITMPIPIGAVLVSDNWLETVYVWLGLMGLVVWVAAVSIPIHRFFEDD